MKQHQVLQPEPLDQRILPFIGGWREHGTKCQDDPHSHLRIIHYRCRHPKESILPRNWGIQVCLWYDHDHRWMKSIRITDGPIAQLRHRVAMSFKSVRVRAVLDGETWMAARGGFRNQDAALGQIAGECPSRQFVGVVDVGM